MGVCFWKTRESNFSAQATFQLSLASMQNKSRRYWMMQYNQSWFENIWINRQNTIFHDLWQKELRMEPVTFEYPRIWTHKTEKSDTKFRKSVAFGKPLAVVASSKLSTRNFYWTISKVFVIGKSTIPIIH